MTADLRLAGAANRLLSPAVVREVIEPAPRGEAACSTIALLADLGMADGARTVRTLMWRCYRWLFRHHRNDHVYRNAVMNQMVPGDGSVLSMQEVTINRSIVDYLLVAEHVHAMEIKSDLDNITRLSAQLLDYRQVAPLVSVVGAQRTIERIGEDDRFGAVGLAWLDSEGIVRILREPVLTTEFLDSITMMRVLRRHEFLGILEHLLGPVPSMPNTKVFSYARQATQFIDPIEYERWFAKTLSMRKLRLSPSALSRVPAPLKPTVLKLNPTQDGIDRLRRWLDRDVGDVLT